MRKTFIFCICIAYISCKNDRFPWAVNGSFYFVENVLETNAKEEVIVKLNIEYSKNDFIWLFYSEDQKDDIIDFENHLVKEVKGDDKSQWVIFEFREGINPERLKIKFSNNRDQKTIRINEVLISRSKNQIRMKQRGFINLFNFSKYISINDDGSINLLIIDGVYDPNVVSSSQLDNELAIL